jgi:hypothetical protein
MLHVVRGALWQKQLKPNNLNQTGGVALDDVFS